MLPVEWVGVVDFKDYCLYQSVIFTLWSFVYCSILYYIWQYRWTWIWRTTVRRIIAYDGRYAWSQSDAYQVFVICIRRILHMTDQFSWSHWVCNIQVHLYYTNLVSCNLHLFLIVLHGLNLFFYKKKQKQTCFFSWKKRYWSLCHSKVNLIVF